MNDKEKHRFSVGLDNNVFVWLKAKATHDRRSLSAMVNELIRQAKEAEQAIEKAT